MQENYSEYEVNVMFSEILPEINTHDTNRAVFGYSTTGGVVGHGYTKKLQDLFV